MDSFTRWGLPELPETRITGIGVNDMKKVKWYYVYLIAGVIGIFLPLVAYLATDNTLLVIRSIFVSFVGIALLVKFFKQYRESKNEVKENDNGQRTTTNNGTSPGRTD